MKLYLNAIFKTFTAQFINKKNWFSLLKTMRPHVDENISGYVLESPQLCVIENMGGARDSCAGKFRLF